VLVVRTLVDILLDGTSDFPTHSMRP